MKLPEIQTKKKIRDEDRYDPQYWNRLFQEGKITHYDFEHRLVKISKRNELLNARKIRTLKEKQDNEEYRQERKKRNNETDDYLHFWELKHRELFPQSRIHYFTLENKYVSRHISKKTIQQVYENNIKKYGTLTCHLCLKPILFGDDSIDHIYPFSKGGLSTVNNLDIAHLICNIKKGNKVLNEHKIAEV